MKNNDQLFKKRMKQGFRGEMEVLGVDEPGGYVSDMEGRVSGQH